MSQRLTNSTMFDLMLMNLLKVRGAEEDNSNKDGEDPDKKDDPDGTSGSGGDGTDKKEDPPETISKEEFEKLAERMRNADRRASTAESKLKEIEDKDKSELEKATRDLGEVTKERDQLKDQNKELALQLAFVSDNRYEWKNPKAALKLADLSEVEIGDDGKVTGLDKALQALAKSDGYLLKEKEDGEGSGGDEKDPPSGAGGSKKPPNGKFNRESLAKKYRIPR